MKSRNNKKLQREYKYFIYAISFIAAILFLILSSKIRAAIIVTAFILLNRIITTYKMFIRVPLEFEFLTLGIVLSTIAFGVKAGLVIAIFGCIVSFILGFELSMFSFPMFMGYISVAASAFLLKGFDVVTIGLVATLVNNLIVFFSYHFLFGYNLSKNISFSLSNIIFNAILFLNFSEGLLKLII